MSPDPDPRVRLIEEISFTETRKRTGYAQEEVDAFLDHLRGVIVAGGPIDELIGSARFGPATGRKGYDMEEVDAFLGALAPDGTGVGESMAFSDQALIREIERVRFTPVRVREGYDMGEVDDLLVRMVAELVAGRPIAELARTARPARVRIREAYKIEDVEAFLDGLAGGGREPLPVEPAPAEAGGVVEEQRGLMSRIFRRD